MTLSRRQSSVIRSFLSMLLLLFMLVSCTNTTYTWKGTTYDSPRPAPSIDTTIEPGEIFRIPDPAGRVTLLYFGYTYCPDVCPATVAIMRQVFEALDASPDALQFAMISVDPERENPEEVRAYMQRFHPDFVGVWVGRDQLNEVQDDYGVISIREPSDNPETYLITHTARVFLIDQAGNLRAHYPFGTTPQDFIDDLSYLMAEP